MRVAHRGDVAPVRRAGTRITGVRGRGAAGAAARVPVIFLIAATSALL